MPSNTSWGERISRFVSRQQEVAPRGQRDIETGKASGADGQALSRPEVIPEASGMRRRAENAIFLGKPRVLARGVAFLARV